MMIVINMSEQKDPPEPVLLYHGTHELSQPLLSLLSLHPKSPPPPVCQFLHPQLV